MAAVGAKTGTGKVCQRITFCCAQLLASGSPDSVTILTSASWPQRWHQSWLRGSLASAGTAWQSGTCASSPSAPSPSWHRCRSWASPAHCPCRCDACWTPCSCPHAQLCSDTLHSLKGLDNSLHWGPGGACGVGHKESGLLGWLCREARRLPSLRVYLGCRRLLWARRPGTRAS